LEIGRLTRGYADRGDYFVDRLAEGVAMIAAAFWPNDVIVRLSDFKTNEYANLLGGAGFEPKGDNPVLGFRGASRYYDERYRGGSRSSVVQSRKCATRWGSRTSSSWCPSAGPLKRDGASSQKWRPMARGVRHNFRRLSHRQQ
jgi:hypothetical protein